MSDTGLDQLDLLMQQVSVRYCIPIQGVMILVPIASDCQHEQHTDLNRLRVIFAVVSNCFCC